MQWKEVLRVRLYIRLSICCQYSSGDA